MKTNPITVALALLAFAAGAVNLGAADNKSSVNDADQKFIKTAGESGMGEVKIATLGTQKAERADVKEFATMLVNDHTKVNEELAGLAKAKGVELSAVISADASDDFKALEKESGAGFDKAFLAQMKDSHEASIANFEDAEKNAADGDVKAWASKTLPALRHHLDKVKELQAK